MPAKPSLTYRDAGVDIDEADRATSRIKKLARATFNERVLADIGAFGAGFSLGGLNLDEPVLVSSADGVGTKLNVAFLMGVHDTVGQDLVNHCVNDIAVQGARPLFFLDYFAVGKLDAGVAEQVVSGLSVGCKENGCALIGGETAEMPGMYRAGEYDLAGFIVGVADRSEFLGPERINDGDVLLGLPSTGLHTNGYSLARKLMFETGGHSPLSRLPGVEGTVGEALLQVHRSYLKAIRLLHEAGLLHGAAHITGGGISDNTPRMLPNGFEAHVKLGSWEPPAIFRALAEIGHVEQNEMLRTFNMGVGMVFAVAEAEADRAVAMLAESGERPIVLGSIVKGAPDAKPRVVYE